MKYLTDGKRHLICEPYSEDNLHKMAEDLNIPFWWFHSRKLPHYDIPKLQIERVTKRCVIVSPKEIVRVIRSSGAVV